MIEYALSRWRIEYALPERTNEYASFGREIEGTGGTYGVDLKLIGSNVVQIERRTSAQVNCRASVRTDRRAVLTG